MNTLTNEQLDQIYEKAWDAHEPECGCHAAGLRAVAEAAVKDAVGGEAVAVVDASDDGWFASILPDTSVKLGQLLYTRPQASTAVPEGWMGDTAQVKGLLSHLDSISYKPDFDGNPVCVDQAAAMSADVIRMVLLPLIAASQPGGEKC